MKRRLIPITLIALAAIAGCGSHQTSAPPAAPATSGASTTTAAPLKVALMTSGPVNDGGWNESAYDGVMALQTNLHAQVSKQENLKEDEFDDAFQDFANHGFTIIFAHGDEYNEPASKIAPKYPNVVFVTTGGDLSGPNLTPITFLTEQGEYLQGMEAALVSKTGKGGFVGGQALPPVEKAAEAFEKGALAINPKFDFKITYINSWTDTTAAKTQTLTLLNNGCDVIAHNCDAAAAGVFDAAGNKPGVFTFGVNANENSKAPNVLSSATLDIPKAFNDIAVSVLNKTYKGGPVNLGMKEGAVQLVDNPHLENAIPSAGRAKVAQAEQDIMAGKITP